MGEPNKEEIGEIPDTPEARRNFFYEQTRLAESDLNCAAIHLTPEELAQFKRDTRDRLNGLCPYYGKRVYVRGMGLVPPTYTELEDIAGTEDEGIEFSSSVKEKIREDDDDEDEGDDYTFVYGVDGFHTGIRIDRISLEGSEEFRVRHSIIIGNEESENESGTIVRNLTFRGFFELDCEIVPVDEVEMAALGYEEDMQPPEDVVEMLDVYSQKFVRLIYSRRFRRSSHEEQIKVVEEFLERVEIKTAIRDRDVVIEFLDETQFDSYSGSKRQPNPDGHIYVPSPREGRIIFDFKQIGPEIIGGICLGITSIDIEKIKAKPIRRDSDLIDKRAGLCLVVEPRNSPSEELSKEPIVYVPISGQTLDAIFE